MNYKKFVHLDSSGNSWGIVSTEQLWANVYAVKYSKPEKRLDKNIWQNLFAQANESALEFGAESIEIRIRLDYEPTVFQNILNELEFKKKSGRIEYQCEVNNLPGEKGTPIAWKTAQGLNWNPQQIANFTREIIKDSLDVDPNEKPGDFIQDWLHCHGCAVFCEMEEWSWRKEN